MKLLHLPTTASTMDDAAKLVRAGDTTTEAVLADTMTAGRGRQGASWTTLGSPYSLAVTYILRPRRPVPHLSLVVALAVYQALTEAYPGLRLGIKWPNDILLNGKKLAGILCETIPNHTALLVGLGLNLTPPKEVPQGFPGTFLASADVTPPLPIELAKAVYPCLLANLTLYEEQGWSALHNNYLHACTTIGQKARWKHAGKQDLTGTARGLTKDGHIEMETDDGKVLVIHSGDIIEINQ